MCGNMHCRRPTSALKNTAPNASETRPVKISVALLCRIRVSSVNVYKYVASEPSIMAAMAQRPNIDLKIRQSIEYVHPKQFFLYSSQLSPRRIGKTSL